MDKYDKTIDEIRKFNRFYTVNMGFLNSDYLETEYSVAETRILFEIYANKICVQNDIVKALGIDKSYLSRIIKSFYKNGLIIKEKSDEDKRAVYISLTEKGIFQAEKLIELTNNQIKSKIKNISTDDCDNLCNALNIIITILGGEE